MGKNRRKPLPQSVGKVIRITPDSVEIATDLVVENTRYERVSAPLNQLREKVTAGMTVAFSYTVGKSRRNNTTIFPWNIYSSTAVTSRGES